LSSLPLLGFFDCGNRILGADLQADFATNALTSLDSGLLGVFVETKGGASCADAGAATDAKVDIDLAAVEMGAEFILVGLAELFQDAGPTRNNDGGGVGYR
jgi:hypothetical protein